MWRREKNLEYWLKRPLVSPGAVQVIKKSKKTQGKVWPWGFNRSVKEHYLDFHADSINLDGSIPVSVSVQDGLKTMDRVDREGTQDPYDLDTLKAIYDVNLIGKARVHPFSLPDEANTRTRQVLLTMIPYCRRVQIPIGLAIVHTPASFHFRPSLIGGNGGIIPDPQVLSLRQEISSLPIRRVGVEINTMPESFLQECLQETKKAKGIPLEQCELITMFRFVPIEIISKLHFLEKKKEIAYSLTPGLNRSGTRVYDLIAIRDISRNEIHLVPHSTRNKMVVLN